MSMNSPSSPAPISAAATRERLAADRARLRSFFGARPHLARGHLWLLPSYQAVYLHRWSHFFFQRGNRLLARVLWHLNLLITGADISPLADIEGGFVLVYPVCTIVLGKAGKNLTVIGHSGFGGGMSPLDIGAGPGLPVIGDDVWLDLGAFILGPVRVGDGVVIKARSLLTSDAPAGSVVDSSPSRIRKAAAADEGAGE